MVSELPLSQPDVKYVHLRTRDFALEEEGTWLSEDMVVSLLITLAGERH